jgi:glycosyltransferase involved in cell wall biosynthesis
MGMSAAVALRILHTEASLGWGGQEIRLLTEARSFAEHGHAVRLVCDPTSDIAKAAPDYGLETETIALTKKSFAALGAMRRTFAGWRPDIVNCHSSIDHWLAAVGRIGMKPRPAIVRTRHISAPVSRNRPTRWLYNRGCEHVMTTSEAMVAELTVDRFLPTGHVTAVPTGIDISRFAPGDGSAARRKLNIDADVFLFGIVATLRSWKGHRFLLDALAGQKVESVRLLIVGDGPQEDNLRNQVAELRLGAAVQFAGRQDDVVPWLQAMDVFVLPSTDNEGVPQALLQAMACGLPVIASAVGGIPEVLAGLEGARQIPPRDAGALGEAMAQARAAPPDAVARAAMRQRVEERYTIEAMYETVCGIFERAANHEAAQGMAGP